MDNGGPERTAVLIPGARYGTSAPLLMYAGDAAEARGAALRHISWSWETEVATLADQERVPFVESRVAPALAEVPGTPLLVGKSLGTYAAGLAADRGLPAVWLTPLLHDERVVAALRRGTAPFLLVGGTADQSWKSEVARELTPHVLEIADADHGMYVPGRLAASTAVLGKVATAIEDFLDQTVWP